MFHIFEYWRFPRLLVVKKVRINNEVGDGKKLVDLRFPFVIVRLLSGAYAIHLSSDQIVCTQMKIVHVEEIRPMPSKSKKVQVLQWIKGLFVAFRKYFFPFLFSRIFLPFFSAYFHLIFTNKFFLIYRYFIQSLSLQNIVNSWFVMEQPSK